MLSAIAHTQDAHPTRDALIELGLPIVRRVAFRMARRLPASVDVGDLIGAGTEGLIKAADHFDPTAYPRFEPYAERRIRGAILDELRSWDPVTRHGRRRMVEVSKAMTAEGRWAHASTERRPSETPTDCTAPSIASAIAERVRVGETTSW